MNQDKLKSLLKQSAETSERQHDCPDDYQLASYMDGGLSERDHSHYEQHLADCAYCIERVGILGRAGETDAAIPALEKNSSNKPLWQKAPRWVAAALVVITVGFLVGRQSPSHLPAPPDELSNPAAVTERYVEQVSPFPEILTPLEGSEVNPETLVFRWKDVPGSLFYDIRIVSDDGALISRQRVWDTQWSLPKETSLQAGAEYFVRVDAFVSEGKAVSSEHTVFKVHSNSE